jgi:subtilisin family serine protease
MTRLARASRSLLSVLALPALLLGAATGARAENFVVLYQKNSVPADAAAAVAKAGGQVVANYAQIGVLVARSDNAGFAATMRQAKGVQGAAATGRFGVRKDGTSNVLALVEAADNTPALLPPTPAPGNDSLSGLQWDMAQILAPQARALNGGSRSIVVGDIDSGLDFTHPDLAPNVDFASSVSCLGGVPDPTPAAWMDGHGHGTHTAGTIAAASNGIGIVGVAPNVKIAGIRAGDANGFFFPEAVVCAFMWTAQKKLAVVNNSYFVDPWLFNCRNDAEQRAIWEAERRAVKYAQQAGTLVVASMSNAADDLAHPTQDATSPDNTTPVTRDISNACAVIPVEIPGVVGVSANGNLLLKSFYSNYGVGVTTVVAPGGDSLLQRTAAAPNGRVLSTWPAALLTVTCGPSSRVVDASGATYCYLQGTSMAGPHVSGVAALIASRGIRNPGAIASKLVSTSDHLACPPDLSIYAPFPAYDNGAPQLCQGTLDYNSFNGNGQVNAWRAVTE